MPSMVAWEIFAGTEKTKALNCCIVFDLKAAGLGNVLNAETIKHLSVCFRVECALETGIVDSLEVKLTL
jgi:hypothetical protein